MVFCDFFGRVLHENYPHLLQGLSSSVDIDSSLESLFSVIVFVLDNQAPLSSFPVRRPGDPWLSAILRARIRDWNYLFRRAKRFGSVLAMAEYSRFRDVLVINLRRAQSDHFLERLRGLRGLAKLWRELANLGLVMPSCMSPLNFFTATNWIHFLSLYLVPLRFAWWLILQRPLIVLCPLDPSSCSPMSPLSMYLKSFFSLPLPHVQQAPMASLFSSSIKPSLGWPPYLRFCSMLALD